MGDVFTISATRWPEQGIFLGRDVLVCFDYDTAVTVKGRVVRDDREEPGELIIELEGGRYVRAVECQWTPVRRQPAGES